MSERKNLVTFILAIIIICLLVMNIFSKKKTTDYEGAFAEEMVRELIQRQKVFEEIMWDVFDKDNVYQNSRTIHTHLAHMGQDSILPDQMDSFIQNIMLKSLDEYGNGFDDERREGFIDIYVESSRVLSYLGGVLDSIADGGDGTTDEGNLSEYNLEYKEYKFLVDADSEGYRKLDEYFRKQNELFQAKIDELVK